MAVRDLAAILGDIIRKGQCPEIVVEYSNGHTLQAEVTVAPFLADKREPRVAARALRVACRDETIPFGESGSFTIKVPGDTCPQPGCEGAEAGPGVRTALRCGAVSMDLTTACEDASKEIPVGIAAAQFSTWVQTPLTEETEQRIQLTSCRGTMTWRQFFTTPGSFGPYLIGMIIWVVGCVAYAAYAAPRIPMLSPELFYQQVQEQIESIPVPKNSPHYAHYRRYYLQQYQQHLTQYRELEEEWRRNNGPRLHWAILLQGLGIGTWIFVAVLGVCEYQYQTVTLWMEAVEDRWKAWRHRSDGDADGGKKRKGGPKGAKKTPVKEEAKPKEKLAEKPPVEPPKLVAAQAPARKKKKQAGRGEEREDSHEKPEEVSREAAAERVQEATGLLAWFGWSRASSEEAPQTDLKQADQSCAAPGEVQAMAPEAEEEKTKGEAADSAEQDAAAAETAQASRPSASKGPEEEPAVEPEPVAEEDGEATESPEDDEVPAQHVPEPAEAEEAHEPEAHAEGKDSQEPVADEEDANENEWHVVTKIKEKKPAPPPNLPEPPREPGRPKEAAPEAPREEEDNFQMPKNLESMSTQDLVAMLQRASLRRQLLRRGVPIREQLLRWFQELQEPLRKLRVAYGPTGQAASSSAAPPAAGDAKPAEPAKRKATPAPWSRLGNRTEEPNGSSKVPMRAEAPEFFPSDMTMMPAGTVLVPCVLPPAQDGTIAIPADHVLVVGAMGLPEGVPLIVPMSESFDSFQEINTQFEMSPIAWPPMPLAQDLNDVSIVDASAIGFLDVPAEDHVAAAIAAAAAAEAASASEPEAS